MTDRYYINPAPKRKKGTMNTKLIRITPEGEFSLIDNGYESLRDGVGSSFDFVYAHSTVGAYIEDEGLLTGARFNLVASLVLQRALFGNVVITKGDTDDEGNTLPPADVLVEYVRVQAGTWRQIVEDAASIGQNVITKANEATVPAPTITGFDDADAFFQAMGIERD